MIIYYLAGGKVEVKDEHNQYPEIRNVIIQYHDQFVQTYNKIDPDSKKETIIAYKSDIGHDQLLEAAKELLLVIDQATSIAIEIKDDSKKTFEEASGAAIYSNSELAVSSCISIFETLWIQSELEKQNKVTQAYFQMFKGLELKEESYSRR